MPTLATARRNHRLSALIARRAVREAGRVRTRGTAAVASVVVAHQLVNVETSKSAVAAALAEQGIQVPADAVLNSAAFTTAPRDLAAMLDQVEGDAAHRWEFDRLVASIVQDAARAAESVAVAVRPGVGWVRHLTPPSCSRCAVLAGRVYRWSDGFNRHPQDDCVTAPVREGDQTFAVDIDAMLRAGQVTGLSKADAQSLRDGADLGQLVNVRRRNAGLLEAGQALARGSRPTPAGIYRMARTREQALELLTRYGYLL